MVLGCAAAVVAAPESALAATATTNFTVNANVLAACSVEATDLDFGDYTASSVSVDDATSTVTVTCTDGEDYTVALDAGAGSSATVAARAMTSGSDELPYGLYTSAAYDTVWGDGTASTSTIAATGNGLQQPHTVYGRIQTGQYVPAGAYVDTILVTVNF